MKKTIFILLILISNYTFGAIKPVERSLNSKKKFLKNSKLKVASIKQEISSIENDINNINAKFSKVVDLKRVLNREIHEGRLNAQKMRSNLEKDLGEIKKIIAGLYLIDGTEEEVEYRFLLLEKLKVKKIKMTELDDSLEAVESDLKGLQVRLNDYEFLESDLLKNLEDLTSGKKKYKKSLKKYIKNVRQGKKDVRALSKKMKKISQKKKRDFILPVQSYTEMKPDKSGSLNFFVEKDENLVAPRDGRIAYSGKLSTYGNVIVIRHRTNLRSVLLGKFLIGVKKGDEVKRGQVLGQVLDSNNKLYFEIRENNKKIYVKNVLREFNNI